jgi:hypothetical protein
MLKCWRLLSGEGYRYRWYYPFGQGGGAGGSRLRSWLPFRVRVPASGTVMLIALAERKTSAPYFPEVFQRVGRAGGKRAAGEMLAGLRSPARTRPAR